MEIPLRISFEQQHPLENSARRNQRYPAKCTNMEVNFADIRLLPDQLLNISHN